jgi:hypothetical protein
MKRFVYDHADLITWIGGFIAALVLSFLHPEHWGELLNQLINH